MSDSSLVLTHANVLTQWEECPRAGAVRAEAGRIVAVGQSVQTDGAEVMDVGGRTVMPGFVDAHIHLQSVGMAMRSVDLAKAASKAAALGQIAEAAGHAEPGTLLRCRGWDESQWPEKAPPTRAELDRVAADRPVIAVRECGHVRVANSAAIAAICAHCGRDEAALAAAGLDRATGMLTGEAGGLAHAYAEPADAEKLEALAAGCEAAVQRGITFAHDLSSDAALYVKLRQQGRLPLRAYVAVHAAGEEVLPTHPITEADALLRAGPVKLFADGSLGAHTAALREPYADAPDCDGMLYTDPALLRRRIAAAHQAGRQVACHAIGDRGLDGLLDAFEAALAESPRGDHRHRIEHCEMPDASAIQRMARLGLIGSVQPNFAGRWQRAGGLYETRLGRRRAAGLNPFAAMAAAGVPLAFGSDGMPMNPLYGVASAAGHPNPAQRIPIEDAIRCYTLGGAYAAFAEGEIGRIAPGYACDLVILDDDPTRASPEQIAGVPVAATIVAGRFAYGGDRRF